MDTIKVKQNIKDLLDKAFDLHQKAYQLEADAARLNKQLNDYQRQEILVKQMYDNLKKAGYSDSDIISMAQRHAK